MMSTFVEGEFWIKKSTLLSSLDEGMGVFNFSDFKLNKEGNSTFNKSRTKEST